MISPNFAVLPVSGSGMTSVNSAATAAGGSAAARVSAASRTMPFFMVLLHCQGNGRPDRRPGKPAGRDARGRPGPPAERLRLLLLEAEGVLDAGVNGELRIEPSVAQVGVVDHAGLKGQ